MGHASHLGGHASHLGGHANMTHLDQGLLQWLIQHFNIKTMVDVGCGLGGMVHLASQLGLTSIGIEGDQSAINNSIIPNQIILNDFTKEFPQLDHVFDLGYSCEFLEHVDQQFMDNYFKVFEKCKYLVVTAAPPKWPGDHHVNCQTHQYWLNQFAKRGFIYDMDLTKTLRSKSTMNLKRPFAKQFIKQRGMFYYNLRYYDSPKLTITISPKYQYHKGPNIKKKKVPGHIFETQLPINSIIGTSEQCNQMIDQHLPEGCQVEMIMI